MSSPTISSPPSDVSPHHSHSPSHHHDGDGCCASTAATSAQVSSSSSSSSHSSSSPSPLTSAPLRKLTSSPSPSSVYKSYITPNDLPSYLATEHPAQPPSYNPYHGLSSLDVNGPVHRSLAVDVMGPSHDPLNLGSLTLSSESPNSLDSFDVPSLFQSRQQKKMEPTLSGVSDVTARLAFNMENFSNCLNGMGPPAPPGGYLEPNNHFFTDAEPIVVMHLLWAVMKEEKVDCEMMVGLFRVKCEAYRDCARCEFHIRLFSVGDGRGKFAVEFQRRFGDGMVFHNLYAETKKQFELARRRSQGEGASSPPSPVAIAPLQCPPLDMPEMRCCRQVKCDVMKVLIGMASSECVDVKANAITALAEMSLREEMKEPMLESGVADIFIENLCCSYQDVHRCSLTGLANLIGCGRNTRTCQLWMKTEKVKHALCKLTKSLCPQIVRECARSFEYIAETLKDQVKDDICFKHCVARLLCSQDVETRESAQRAQEQIRMVQ